MNSRRTFLKRAATVSAASALRSTWPRSGAAAPTTENRPYSAEMQDMLLAYLAGRTNRLAEAW
jgi:hypothetical protein